MWIPKSAAELEDAAHTGRFLEKSDVDAKREIAKGMDVATDVNAMALEGGLRRSWQVTRRAPTLASR
jgi:hypothetical protein